MILNVPKNDPDIGIRLDLYLAIKLSNVTRSEIKKTIESNQVKVNREVCYKPAYRVQVNDKIEFPINSLENRGEKLIPSEYDLETIYEDNDYIVVNKPSGLLTHPLSNKQNNTLLNKVLGKYQNLPQSINDKENIRPGIVHRLDKLTSGVIILAKSSKGLWWLSKSFQQREVKKSYISIGISLNNEFNKAISEEITVENMMMRCKNYKEYKVVEYQNLNQPSMGKFSKTRFKILDTKKISEKYTLSLFEVTPLTGRTHQIRLHQQYIHCPIIFDPIYSKIDEYQKHIFRSLPNIKIRLYLHAQKISFKNYDGNFMKFECSPSNNFKKIFSKNVI